MYTEVYMTAHEQTKLKAREKTRLKKSGLSEKGRKQFCLKRKKLSNCKCETQQFKRENESIYPKGRIQRSSSEKEHKGNALASGAEEGRDKLRKAAVSCK